jgi:hypothetical protein
MTPALLPAQVVSVMIVVLMYFCSSYAPEDIHLGQKKNGNAGQCRQSREADNNIATAINAIQ